MEFGEALGAISALQEERLTFGGLGELRLQIARLAGENQRRGLGKGLLGRGQRLGVGLDRHLIGRLLAPAIGGPLTHHD
ncbi:MAG: hypothetical protein O7I42_03170 [Alphaproteobacteria bacterium]|nr:hypothetical protein [Alphaproteobacteria bacterium]